MDRSRNRVLIVGAGPVGLCLALKLAREGVASTLIEQLADENFLHQVPRAGTNHPATLEMYDEIGLYDKLEPRGIIAPLFHYWDREKTELIAEFDHIHLRNDTPFPYALQCERIKIVEEALKMAKAHPLIEVRMATNFVGFSQDRDGVTASVDNEAGEREALPGRYIVSAEGARSIVRKECAVECEELTYPDRTLNIEVAYDFRRHGYTDRNYISDPEEWSNLFHWKGPPERWRGPFPPNRHGEPGARVAADEREKRLHGLRPTR